MASNQIKWKYAKSSCSSCDACSLIQRKYAQRSKNICIHTYLLWINSSRCQLFTRSHLSEHQIVSSFILWRREWPANNRWSGYTAIQLPIFFISCRSRNFSLPTTLAGWFGGYELGFRKRCSLFLLDGIGMGRQTRIHRTKVHRPHLTKVHRDLHTSD